MFIDTQRGTGRTTRMLEDAVEDGAIAQFVDVMNHPSITRGALMPDAHQGYTLPIGGVVESKGMVFPSFVGYDIGCIDCDTEFLTQFGWKKMSDCDNTEKIMVYDEITNKCKFEYPIAYIKNDCDFFVHLDNKTVNQKLTHDHRVLLFPPRKDTRDNSRGMVDYLENWLDNNDALKKGVSFMFKTTIPFYGGGVELTDDEIRMIISISADGHIRKSKTVEYHLKKQRKIDRLLMLCEKLGIEFSEFNLKDGSFGCSFNFIKATKDLSFLWKASRKQLEVVIDEVKYWDGHIKSDGRVTYSSTIKDNIDVIQYAYAVCGIRANFYKSEAHNDWNDCYQLYTTNNSMTHFPSKQHIKKVKSKDGKSYCFVVDTGYFVIRRNGKLAITGNCGVCALPLSTHSRDIKMKAKKIQKQIMRNIPVGFNKHRVSCVESQSFIVNVDTCTKTMHNIYHDKNGDSQLGTLGGGNHFIEIGVDEYDRVWAIIHSGSRGIGHGCATHYMKKASPNDKASEGCFGFDVDSRDGIDYIKDMNFCLEFALLNRKIMLRLVIDSIRQLGLECSGLWDTLINRNHNHATSVDGVHWIHRKGATHAEENMMGVIPGNMRDGSFIVRGLGNNNSLQSSSHGAGRVLSRKKAKKTLDIDEFRNTMEGIVANVDHGTLDESPMAYKNIFDVMRLQHDLVDVVAHIKPILNVKG